MIITVDSFLGLTAAKTYLETTPLLTFLFVSLYGFIRGGFSSTYSGVLKEMEMADEGVNTGLIMDLLLGG